MSENTAVSIKRAPTVYSRKRQRTSAPIPDRLPSPSPASPAIPRESEPEEQEETKENGLESELNASPERENTVVPQKSTSAPRRVSPSQPSSKSKSKPKETPKPKPILQQLTLDFGQKQIGPKRCADCGMSYNPVQKDDEEVHRKFHKAVTAGIEWPVGF